MLLRNSLTFFCALRVPVFLVLLLSIAGCQTQQAKNSYVPASEFKATNLKKTIGDETTVSVQKIDQDASTVSALAESELNSSASRTALAIVDGDPKTYETLPQTVPVPKTVSRKRRLAAIPSDSPLFGSRKLRGPVKPSRVRVAQLTRKPNFFQRAKLRKRKYQRIVAKHARANGVPLKLAMAVVEIESSFRAKARGLAGEIGLMQLMPRTARGIGYRGPLKKLYHPDTNVRYGMKYLGEAHRRGGGSVCGTILKYNAGHYAKRMNPISAKYCKRVKRLMAKNDA